MTIDDGRLFLQQPDGSIIVLDLQTGAVLNRVTQANLPRKTSSSKTIPSLPISKEVIIIGNAVIGKNGTNKETFILDKRTCEILYNRIDHEWRRCGDFIVFRNRSGNQFLSSELYALNINSLSATQLKPEFSTNGGLMLDLHGDLGIFQISERYSPGTLEAIDLSTGNSLWTIKNTTDRAWQGVVFDNESIHIFAGPEHSRNIRLPCEIVLSFSPEGNELTTTPATKEMFGGRIPLQFYAVSFKGVSYRYGMPHKQKSDSTPDKNLLEKLRGKIDLSRYWHSVKILPNGSIFVIQLDGVDKSSVFFLDSRHTWETEIVCLTDLAACESHFETEWAAYQSHSGLSEHLSFASNDDHLVYASISGKVECFDKVTGRSIWIYAFPMRPINRQNKYLEPSVWEIWGKCVFFTDEIAYYEQNIDELENTLNLRALDGKGPTTFQSDPEPFFKYVPGTDQARFWMRAMPVCTLLIIGGRTLYLRRKPNRNGDVLHKQPAAGFCWNFSLGMAAIAANACVFWMYGRYSHSMTIFLAGVCLVILLFTIWSVQLARYRL